ncbi:hypothetical protein O1611_g9574 [Lasiodiplodia mahajangana]|uniref:Uncharacterized protein n=1 Tax=Lasiodiplodia mahajangana TaxID=1108764 RepID=A0ACC2J7X3_9PEZI|nr:hypothetical protein O1611_g9574 [Lasiodiplodia mahajangana]
MRGSKPVCLLCRLQVAQAASKTRAVQWQTQTARLSTTPSRRDAADAGRAAPTGATISESASTQSRSKSPQYPRRYLSPRSRSGSNVRIPQIKITGDHPSSRVDALFQQIVQEQQGLQDAASHEPTSGSASNDLALVRGIGKLEELMDTSVVDAYLYFQTEIHPAVQIPGTHVPQAYHRTKLALLEKLVAAKRADMFSEELPPVADIFRIYAEAGELKPKQWTILVGELVQCIINIDPSTETQSIAKYERLLALREAMLVDLVESWKVLSLPRLAASPAEENQLTNNFWFPRLDKFSLSKFATKGNFSGAFGILFPQYPPNQLGPPVAVLAIATYTLMHDSKRCSVEVRESASRFMYKVGYLITFVNYRGEDLGRELVSTFPGLEEYVMGLWPKIKAYLKQNPVEKDEGTEVHRISLPADENKKAFDAGSIGYRLSRTHGTRNSGALDILWEEFVGSEKTISEERAAQIRQHPALMDSFIKTRMTFNQPDKAIAAWNVLGKVGLKPSLRTWNLMLDGLRKAGNINGIKNIWAKLAKSGMQLDTAIWTTRIASLIDCGDIEGGLHALEEMTRLWGKGTNKNAVMPTIEPVNAALSGLIRHQRHDVAEKLLAWASRKGLEPDVVTYNSMLRALIRRGDSGKEVEKIFATMQAKGVRANEATFVIVLDASFSKKNVRDPEDQAKLVANVASAMAKAGLELNMQTYGKMIYVLLQSNATDAAMAVVNHLYNRNLELSPHIYTMLVEHCFEQNPPALDSVHLFVQRRRRVDFDDMDRIFYDRVVRGYSLVGETGAALDVHKHVVKAGGQVSISTLFELLRALIRQNRLGVARDMVNFEKKQFEARNPDPTVHAAYWGHRFWQVTTAYNLLDTPLPSFDAPDTGAESNGTVTASQSPEA